MNLVAFDYFGSAAERHCIAAVALAVDRPAFV